MPPGPPIAAGVAAAVVLALAARAWLAARRRRAAEIDEPPEEHPRLRNQWRVQNLVSNRVRKARIVHAPDPAVVRFRITEQGRPVDASVIHSSGDTVFDEVVLGALRHARFHPARVNGRPVKVWVEMPFTHRPFARRG